jgi:hypothetical protein
MGIAVALNQDIDHVSILVHSPPEIVPLALDIHEELVQVPDVSQLPLVGGQNPIRPEIIGVSPGRRDCFFFLPIHHVESIDHLE